MLIVQTNNSRMQLCKCTQQADIMTLAPGRQNVHSVRQNDDDVSAVELFADVHKQQTYAEADAAVSDDATAFCLFDVRAPKSVQHTNTNLTQLS